MHEHISRWKSIWCWVKMTWYMIKVVLVPSRTPTSLLGLHTVMEQNTGWMKKKSWNNKPIYLNCFEYSKPCTSEVYRRMRLCLRAYNLNLYRPFCLLIVANDANWLKFLKTKKKYHFIRNCLYIKSDVCVFFIIGFFFVGDDGCHNHTLWFVASECQ